MNGDQTIAEALFEHIRKWEEKPAEVEFEEFAKDAPSMMFQQLSGTVVTRQYVNGSYIGAFPFAVYMRIDGSDTKSKLSATKTLCALNKWLKTQPLPDIGEGRRATEFDVATPSRAAAYEDGTEDYQIVLNLTYFCKGGL